jgi:hypothetical protein
MIRTIAISLFLFLGVLQAEAGTLPISFDFGNCSGVTRSVNGLTVLCWNNRIESLPSGYQTALVDLSIYRRSTVGWDLEQKTLDLRTIEDSERCLGLFSEAKISDDGKRILVLSRKDIYDGVCMVDGPDFSMVKQAPKKFVEDLMNFSGGSVDADLFRSLRLTGNLTHVEYLAGNGYYNAVLQSLESGDILLDEHGPSVQLFALSPDYAVIRKDKTFSVIHLKSKSKVYEGYEELRSNVIIKDGKIQYFGADYYLNEIDISSGKSSRKLLNNFNSSKPYRSVWVDEFGCSIAQGSTENIRLDIANDLDLGSVARPLFGSYRISPDCQFAVKKTTSFQDATTNWEVIDISAGLSNGNHVVKMLNANQEFGFINQYGDLFYRVDDQAGILSYK